MTGRFIARFGEKVAILRPVNGEKCDEWRKVNDGDAQLLLALDPSYLYR